MENKIVKDITFQVFLCFAIMLIACICAYIIGYFDLIPEFIKRRI